VNVTLGGAILASELTRMVAAARSQSREAFVRWAASRVEENEKRRTRDPERLPLA
jgi:hypothetical protein